MRARRLALRREAVAALTPDDLAGVAGGAIPMITKDVDACYQQYVTPLPTNSPMCLS